MKDYGEKYYLGLDIGTNSVGWAVTDEQYNLRRAKGKDLWGARLFDEAESSAGRRSYRTNRRRIARERARIGILMELFEEEINKIDPNFFMRLRESKYHLEDRSEDNHQKFAVFTDKNYTDEDYFKEYKTIFHLRKELIENNKDSYDVRLVFLALLNMFKHRGNFLNENMSVNSELTIESAWNSFVETAELYSFDFNADVDTKELESILGTKGVSRSKIEENLLRFLSITKTNKAEKELVSLICGKTAKLINIFGPEIIDEENKGLFLCFRDSNYEENSAKVKSYLSDEIFELLVAAKEVHDIGLLSSIMRGTQYISFARVDMYEKHQEDLRLLKSVFKKDKKVYNDFFRDMQPGNYSSYIGSVNSDQTVGKIRRSGATGRSTEDLYKTIKSILAKFPQDDADVTTILGKIAAEDFLLKQLTSENGVIPNQVYVSEMKTILNNAEKYLPFLLNRDEYGYTVSERILMLFSFRIPYYVGPIGQEYLDKKGYNVWAERKEFGRVYPWNFEEKIDTKKAAEKFINRMVRHCTYLNDETTLPKNSLLYEKFMVLNEINNIAINGEKISVETKQDIYKTLFSIGKKVSISKLDSYFKQNGFVDKNDDVNDYLTGIDVEGGIKASLSSYGKFKAVFGEINGREEMIEKIIFWLCIYGDDKSFVRDKIKEEYASFVSDDQLKRILGFKVEGWGNLSKEFLNTVEDTNCGDDSRSIINALWNTNDNLQILLGSNYSYRKVIDEKINRCEKTLEEWKPEDLDGMYLSNPVKRMVWQTMLVMKELTEVTGKAPDRIFVEMPREDGEKGKRTASRKKKLTELYSALGKEGKEWKDDLDKLNDAELRSKKLYLYYKQMGVCMYSGETIDLHTLLTDNTSYDIDHIFPRHFIKDDSIENNLVLVKKQMNATKSDSYPLPAEWRNHMKSHWKYLYDKGFISKQKYNRLIRTTAFTDEEKASFISRQLVETRQGTKAITNIIEQMYPEATVVFTKAGEVSDFRNKYDLPKVRCVNDIHHAHDAYLNIVVGNTYFVKFTSNPLNFIHNANKYSDSIYKYNMDAIFAYDVIRNDEIAWIGTGTRDKNKDSISLNIVKSTLNKNSVLITRKAYKAHGGITGKDTVYGKNVAKPESYIAMSSDPVLADVTKYGGRTQISGMCYCLVQYELKGKKVLSLESLPLYLGNIDEIADDKLINYLTSTIREENSGKEIDNLIIKRKCIRFYSLVKIDGYYYYLGGKTGTSIYLKNAQQLFLDNSTYKYVKKIENAFNKSNYDEKDVNKELIISSRKNIYLYDLLCKKMHSSHKNKKCSISEIVKLGKTKFEKLSMELQIETLLQMIMWFDANCSNVDLVNIGGSKQSGTCRLNKKISSLNQFILIDESVTGLCRREVDLLNL
ncbi:MAG: type II CRISPR RNA-guided endonuclease Cas9 [Lachnospiraceae bacterium]|nr:type II CRISPR RNA-guided endonuclease Cas9 [Lachnospiraceae bacterium]